MFHHNRYQGQRGGVLNGLVGVLALGGAVFLAPAAWPLVEGLIWSNLTHYYDHDVASWLRLGAWLGMYPAAFFALRMALSALFMSITLWAAKRLI